MLALDNAGVNASGSTRDPASPIVQSGMTNRGDLTSRFAVDLKLQFLFTVIREHETYGQHLFVERKITTSVASYDFVTGIDGNGDVYVLVGFLKPATDQVSLYLTVSDDGGSTFEAGSGYNAAVLGWDSLSREQRVGLENQAQFKMHEQSQGSADAEGQCNFVIFCYDLQKTVGGATQMRRIFKWELAHGDPTTAGRIYTNSGGGLFDGNTNAINGLRLAFSGGNIAVGAVSLFRVKQS